MATRPPGDFGRKLREARERRGISLRQIAGATKIGVSALEALERNDISRLPGGIFSRAFVRSYAIEVGLDPETTIREFIAQFPHDSVTVGHPLSPQAEDHDAVESDRRTAVTFVRLVVMSIPIAVAVVYFGTAQPEPPPADPSRATRRDGPRLPPPAATPAAVVTVADETAAADRLTVLLSAQRECRVTFTVDDGQSIERRLQPGDQETLEVSRELVLTIDDATAVDLMVNGVRLRALGADGESVTTRLNHSNFKEYVANP
jgi:transcriptional regulator with XRE-family HTH domain